MTDEPEILKQSLSVAKITEKLTPETIKVLEQLIARAGRSSSLGTQSVAWLVGLGAELIKLTGGVRVFIPEVRTVLGEYGLDLDPLPDLGDPLLTILVSHYLQDTRGLPEAVKTLLHPSIQTVMKQANGNTDYAWWNTPEFRWRLGECEPVELMQVLRFLLPQVSGAEGLFTLVEGYFATASIAMIKRR